MLGFGRRSMLGGTGALLAAGGLHTAREGTFEGFLDGMKAEARQRGIAGATIERAFVGVRFNDQVIERDRTQPEFTMTWAEYREKIVGPQRLADARAAGQGNRALLRRIADRYGADPGVIVGIWGLESNFGTKTGSFLVVEALATLAYEGRRAGYFRTQLLNALRILDHHDIDPARMTGSWAGAMGQPQFMPDSYLAYAVDVDGKGRRDIWTDRADVFGSIANYLARNGWRPGEPAAEPVFASGLDPDLAGHEAMRPISFWQARGVRVRAPVSQAALLLPDGAGGQAFLVYANFMAVRRYNPSDFYALAVALIANAVAA